MLVELAEDVEFEFGILGGCFDDEVGLRLRLRG